MPVYVAQNSVGWAGLGNVTLHLCCPKAQGRKCRPRAGKHMANNNTETRSFRTTKDAPHPKIKKKQTRWNFKGRALHWPNFSNISVTCLHIQRTKNDIEWYWPNGLWSRYSRPPLRLGFWKWPIIPERWPLHISFLGLSIETECIKSTHPTDENSVVLGQRPSAFPKNECWVWLVEMN